MLCLLNHQVLISSTWLDYAMLVMSMRMAVNFVPCAPMDAAGLVTHTHLALIPLGCLRKISSISSIPTRWNCLFFLVSFICRSVSLFRCVHVHFIVDLLYKMMCPHGNLLCLLITVYYYGINYMQVFNHMHFPGQKFRVWAEYIPQICFLVGIFGYMDLMILMKYVA